MIKFRLNLTVFISGFVVMAFEIIGSRMLAPFLGTSTLVWVSIIGVILLAMSAGYYFGGQRADRLSNHKFLSRFLLLAAIGICLSNLAKNQVLDILGDFAIPLVIKATVASMILFSIPAFFLAAIFPYALKLLLTGIGEAGKVAGKFYAISTIGSILGTFLSATILIPLFGTNTILWILASILFATAMLFSIKLDRSIRSIVVVLILINVWYANRDTLVIDFDSEYNRIWVFDAVAQGEPARYLSLNGHVNSGMWVNDPIHKQLYAYSDYFRLAMHFHPTFESTLMLGAGAYTFPKLYQALWPNKELDIVEIDPKLALISEEYFSWEPSASTQIYHEDARTFINRSDKKYDIIISDVFTSPLEVPFQMTTLEAYAHQYKMLENDGVLILNVLGNSKGRYSSFLKSQVETAHQWFPLVLLFEVNDGGNSELKNNMLVAFKRDQAPNLNSQDPEIQKMLNNLRDVHDTESSLVMTDDFAPANWLLRSQ